MTARQLLVFTALFLFATPVLAKNYSCIDQEKKLHIADDIMSLPQSCRDEAQEIKKDAGRVTYVPAKLFHPETADSFKKLLQQKQATRKEQDAAFEELQQGIAQLLTDYEKALKTRQTARRKLGRKARQIRQLASNQLQEIRVIKVKLLADMEKSKLRFKQRLRLQQQLDQIQ